MRGAARRGPRGVVSSGNERPMARADASSPPFLLSHALRQGGLGHGVAAGVMPEPEPFIALHQRHAAEIRARWREGPRSDDPDTPSMGVVYLMRCRSGDEVAERTARLPAWMDRYVVAGILGRQLAIDGARPEVVSYGSEAWKAMADGGPVPSQHPDREEIFVVTTADAIGRAVTSVHEISRSPAGEARLGRALAVAEPAMTEHLARTVFTSYTEAVLTR